MADPCLQAAHPGDRFNIWRSGEPNTTIYWVSNSSPADHRHVQAGVIARVSKYDTHLGRTRLARTIWQESLDGTGVYPL